MTLPDPAAAWVRRTSPTDDYLPRPDLRVRDPHEIAGGAFDDEGHGPEGLALAEERALASPELRRAMRASGRSLPVVSTRQLGRRITVTGTWERSEYQPPVAPAPGRRPEQGAVVWHGRRGGVEHPERDRDVYVDPALLVEADESPPSTAEDRYAALAERHVPWDLDERTEWERELGLPDDWCWRQPEAKLAATTEPEPTTKHLEPVTVAACSNPGCDRPVKSGGRCAACHEYRRRHRGDERPIRLLNRDRRRKRGF